MKTIFISLLLVFGLANLSRAQEEAVIRAFPGAEGYGMNVTGGRGGEVYYVTTLEDNARLVGSLRNALMRSGPRIIMFKISGTIELTSDLKITRGDVTIAGQTAPGDGITLRNYPVFVDADNVIIRFMRFRMGDTAQQEGDAIWGRHHKNIILDHCSMSWSTDECSSFYNNENFTMQWCVLSESLRNSVHGKGEHGYGGIWGGTNATFHHNLIANHDSRNPRFCGSRFAPSTAETEHIDHRNNVIYNWGGNSCYAAEGGSYNIVNNYYKAGPASSHRDRIIQPWADNGKNDQPKDVYGMFFVDGNVTTASNSTTENNLNGIDLSSSITDLGLNVFDITVESNFTFSDVTTHTAELAYDKVSAYAGASLKRDAVDERVISDMLNGTVTYPDGGNGSRNGLIDTQDAVGGWPVLQSTPAPVDTDEDGMPDEWESANGLNANDPSDAQLKTVDGLYPNVEVYINSLVADIVTAQNEEGVLVEVKKLTENSGEIGLYFNNAAQQLVVDHSTPITEVWIYSTNGSLLVKKSVYASKNSILLNNLKSGVYIARVKDSKNKNFAKMILVK